MTDRRGPVFFERMELIDALRGFALFGLFLVHMLEYFELYWLETVPSPFHDLVFDIFAGKAFALFALSFGLSFHIIMDRAASRGLDFTARFAWRLALLFGFGVVHSLLYRGDILTILAPLGLLLLVFNRIRDNRALFVIALFCFIQPQQILLTISALSGADWANLPPAYWSDPTIQTFVSGSFLDVLSINITGGSIQKFGFYWDTGRVIQIIGLFITGLILGRIGFFRDPGRYLLARRVLLVALAILAVSMNQLEPLMTQLIPDTHGPMARTWFAMGWSNVVDLAFMGVQVIVFTELWRGIGKTLLGTLAPTGRMTLTLYILQSVIFVPIFYGYGLGLYDDVSQGQALVIGLVAFALQMIGARLWFVRFRYGPLEWLWRALTYTTTKVPFRQKRQLEI